MHDQLEVCSLFDTAEQDGTVQGTAMLKLLLQ